MTKYFITGLLILFSANVFAEESYYLDTLKNCYISQYDNGSFVKMSNDKFINRILNTKTLKKHPNLVGFKVDGLIYVTDESCVVSAVKKDIPNQLTSRDEITKKTGNVLEKDKFNSYKHFIEFDMGIIKVSDQNAPADDYNQIFPSTSTTNPTTWNSTGSGGYKSGPLLSLGFGFRQNNIRFLAFKFRLLNGKKSDSVDLVDVNTGISQSGLWTKEDSLKNFYAGFKYILLDYSAWKPVFGVYLGVSQMTSTLSDGGESFQLSSLGPAALAEAGIEYHLNSHWGIGGMFGFEYLGKRTMKFSDESMGLNYKTNMSYTNQYFSFGVKFYFK